MRKVLHDSVDLDGKVVRTCLGMLQESPREFDVPLMARALGNDVPPYTSTDQCQISNQIPDLMSHEFVIESKAVVHHSLVVENDGILERCSLSEPSGPQGLGIVMESEGAGRSDFAAERLLGHVEYTMLPPDRLVLKIDGSGHTERVRRRHDIG